MCSNNIKDFEDWRNLEKLREEVEIQKSKVESLKSEQKWINNSFSASDFCSSMRLDRSDSGIDRQSLLMECKWNDSRTNLLYPDCSTSSIKKIIEITSLIRIIEQQINVPQHCTDSHSIKTYSSTCSMPRCIHEFPEQDYSNTSWIHNQLMSSSIEHEKLSKQLSYYHNQIFKIENVTMPALLNGITTDQLKKRVDEYYKLKSCLTNLATSSTCNSTAMIAVVKQLEPIAQNVEQYFKVSHELKNVHNQISVIMQRKNILQNKRHQLLKILQMSNNQKSRNEISTQSESGNKISLHALNLKNIPRNEFPGHSSDDHSKRETEPRLNEDMKQVLKDVDWPPFNGDGISEENPPKYDETLLKIERKTKTHSRLLCHEYVNEDVIKSKEYNTIAQSIDLIISSFPSESIAIIQVKSFKLQHPFQNNQQYRARLLRLNGDGSDWNNICSSNDGKQIFISPYIILPINWIFSSTTTLSLLLELQFIDKRLESTSDYYMFNIRPLKTIQKISVPLHSVQLWNSNSEYKLDMESSLGNQKTHGFLKIPQGLSNNDSILSRTHLITNPPVQYSSIRRSQTYSHDHQYCGNYECCSNIDFVSEPIPRMNPKYVSQLFNIIPPIRNKTVKSESSEESISLSTCSSFKRQSIFRQPIRVKRNSNDTNVDCEHLSQNSDHQNNDILIQNLWSVVYDLYLAMNTTLLLEEKLLVFAYFKTRCPSNLLKLYNYFVETIFEPDQK